METQQNFIKKLQNSNTNNKFLKIVFALNILTALSLISLCSKLVKLNKTPSDFEKIFSTLASMADAISYSLNLLYFIFAISIISIALIFFNYKQHKQKLTRPDILLSLTSNVCLGLFFILNFKSISTINNFLKNLKSGNILSSLLDAGRVDPVPSIKNTVIIGVIVLIINLLAVVVGYFKLFKDTNILSKFDFSTLKNAALKMNKKVALSIVVLVIIISTYFVYKTFIYKKNVDVLSNITLKYDGLSGRGMATVDGSPTPTDDPEINKFLQTVRYKLSKNNGLKNGDTVSVTADFDLDLSKKYNLKIPKVKKDFKVEGLNRIVSDINDLPKNVIDKIKNDVEKKINSLYSDRQNFTMKHLDTYYKTSDNNDSKNLSIMSLYTIEYDSASFFNEVTHQVANVIYGGNNIILDQNNTLVKYSDNSIPSFFAEKDPEVKRKQLETEGYSKLP